MGEDIPNLVATFLVPQEAFVLSTHKIVNQLLVVKLPAGTAMADTGCSSAVGGSSFRRALERTIDGQ